MFLSALFLKFVLENHVNSIQSTNVHSLSLAHCNKSASSQGIVIKVLLTKSAKTEIFQLEWRTITNRFGTNGKRWSTKEALLLCANFSYAKHSYARATFAIVTKWAKRRTWKIHFSFRLGNKKDEMWSFGSISHWSLHQVLLSNLSSLSNEVT